MEVVVQFNHTLSFKKIPGSMYLIMVLDVCHASFSCKMDEDAASLELFEHSAYPGENISKFSNEAQRLIKTMKDGYALPYQLGSKLVAKVCTTQSLYFNRTMYNVIDKVLAIEKAHGPHRDPKALEKAASYKEYEPFVNCVKILESYSDLVTTKQWPALVASIPAANFGSVTGDKTSGARKNPNGMKCHDCGSDYHFKGRDYCPKTTKLPVKDNCTVPAEAKGSGDWKFNTHSDENSTVAMNTIEYHYYKYCVCKWTGVNDYSTTHMSLRTIQRKRLLHLVQYLPSQA